MRREILLGGLIVMICFVHMCWLNDYYRRVYHDEYDRRVATYKMSHNLTYEHFGRTGVYIKDKFYCVWIEGYEDIWMDTKDHEQCHHLVRKNYEHYCGEVK